MKYKYGEIDKNQFNLYKIKLHKKLFWLILYKDPDTKQEYSYVDFDKYFLHLMYEINGLNELLYYPEEMVEIMSLLQAAYNQTKNKDFDYKVYRKFILDAHALVDKIDENEVK